MKYYHFPKIIILFSIILPSLVHGQTREENLTIEVNPFNGFCFYDPSYEADAVFLEKIKTRPESKANKAVLRAASSNLVPCSYLGSYRDWYTVWWKRYFTDLPKPYHRLFAVPLARIQQDEIDIFDQSINKTLCIEARSKDIVIDINKLKDHNFAREFKNDLPLKEKSKVGLLLPDSQVCYLGSFTKTLDGGSWNVELNIKTTIMKQDVWVMLGVNFIYSDYASITSALDSLNAFVEAQ